MAGDLQHNTKQLAQHGKFPVPDPIVVAPTQPHDFTIIFLHGRGFNASNFHKEMIHFPIASEKSLSSLFPNAKFVFPNAPVMRAFKYRKSLMPQWYEGSGDWETESLGNMKGSIEFIHALIHSELELVGDAKKIVLGGFSQGCAMALMSLLLWDGPSLGAFVGLCGFMPFTSSLMDILSDDQNSEEDDVFESTGEDSDRLEAAMRQLCFETEMEPNQSPSKEFISTPVFMAHGEEDPEVEMCHPEQVVALLSKMDLDASLHKYKQLGHSLSGDMLGDMGKFITQSITKP